MTEDEFWSCIDKHGPSECWPWAGACFNQGYGEVSHGGARWRAHRLVWTLVNGPIPTGLHVCHSCDNPPCCNPAHLWLGTHADNMADKARKGRGEQVRGDNHYARTHPEWLARGERHGLARLTEAHAQAVRRVYATGTYSQAQISRVLGVSHTVISKIVRGKTYRHLLPS